MISLVVLSSFTLKSDCVELKIVSEQNGDFYIFTGKSDKDVSLWYWSLGDGTTNTGQTIRHQFKKSGIYEVCLRVRAAENCSGSICEKIEVKVANNNYCDLGADFKFDLQGNNLVLAARSNAGPNVRYTWDFGNGQQARGQEVSHKFEKNGSYNVCLTATGSSRTASDGECSQKVCKTIRVNAATNDCNIRADFRFALRNNILTVQGSSNQGNNAQYTWVFGDGTRTLGIQARHQYKQRGSYQVCLIVSTRLSTTNTPCQTRVCKTVNVGVPDTPAPIDNDCKLEVGFQYRNDGNIYSLFARSNERGATYYWSISGHNTRLEGQNITHTFATPGVYEVCVIAVSEDGKCRTRSCQRVTVGRSITPYPNPTTDKLTIGELEDVQYIQVIDKHYNTVLTSYDHQSVTSLDVSHLNTGTYTLVIHFIDGSSESKIFVKR